MRLALLIPRLRIISKKLIQEYLKINFFRKYEYSDIPF